jgi:hypothetical protein
MTKDTIETDKNLRPDSEVVQKLLELRDYLWDSRKSLSVGEVYICYKINSCLYQPKEKKSYETL